MEITAAMLAPLTDGINGNIAILLPVGIGIMATFISIKLIPKAIGWFIK